MKLLHKYKFTLAVVLFAIIFIIAASMGAYSAFADRTVTIDGSNFFYANSGASVRAQQVVDQDTEYYTSFHFLDDDDNVTYRYNLAYHWFQADDTDETVGEEGWFNLTIGFADDDFDRFTIKFQSQQYAETEDGVTTNYAVFVSDRAGNVTVYLTDDEDELETDLTDIEDADKQLFSITNNGTVNRITIAFTDHISGNYAVQITDEASSDVFKGEFVNVGGNYSKRVNSTTNGVMPLTFSATFDEDLGDTACDMVLFCLNNQSFLLNSSDITSVTDGDETYYTGTTVTDDEPPVLCLTGNLTYLEFGEQIDFDYVVIDVLASSPKSTIHYYVLSEEIYSDAKESGSISYFTNDETTNGDSLFDKTSSDDFLVIESANPFFTNEIIDSNKTAYDDNGCGYTVGCLVKVYIELTDVTSTAGNKATTNVYLDWYVDSAYLAEVAIEAGGDTSSFLMAVTDERGATYLTNYDEYGNETKAFDTLVSDYQAKVDELAYDENGNVALSAGSSSEFYLPAFTGFITDNLDGYEDLTYSIYYTVDGSENSATSLSYNNLSISLSTAGTYRFTIYATDSASNNMYYIKYTTDDSGDFVYDSEGKVKYELVEFESGDIYDDDIKDYLPWFTFDVVYTGVTIEDPGEQTTGYVDTTYSVTSFDINGVSSYYETAYALYRFDRVSFNADTGLSLSYSDYVEAVAALYENTYFDGNTDTAPNGERYCDINTRAYFTKIKALADLNETDDDYDDFCDYEWDADDLTFVPQDENAYYLVRLTVSDTYNHQAAVYSYMGIHVSAAANSYSGESDWVANNLASIILFSIAGAALIGIIVLFIVKPKDSGDIDEQLANEADGGKKKKNKKEKSGNAQS